MRGRRVAIPIYSYPCRACGLTTEAIRPLSCEQIICACGQAVRRSGANRVAVVAPSVDTRNMYRRFSEASAEIDHSLSTVEQQTGQPAPPLGLWDAAKRQAVAMTQAGENPVLRKDR